MYRRAVHSSPMLHSREKRGYVANERSSSTNRGGGRAPGRPPGKGSTPARGPKPASAKTRAGAGRGGPGSSYGSPPGASRQYFVVATWVAVAAALVAVIVLVTLKVTSPSTTASPPSRLASASLVQAVTHVPQAAADAVGISGDPSQSLPVSPPIPVKGQSLLTVNGKPEVLYIGAEYCPFCAAERWPMVVALSRFGAFSHLGITASSTTDIYAGTKTFTFYNSTYTSPYLVFEPVETETVSHASLQQPTPQQNALISKYDGPPYTGPASSSNTAGAIPFIDLGNQFIVSGASYTPAVLSGDSRTTIASELAHPSSIIAKLIVGSANYLTAAICVLTHDQPASACSIPAVIKAQKALGAG